jgi:hypothetical protein
MVQATLGITAMQVLLMTKNSEAMTMTKNGTGKPGDFEFLTGEWRIENRRKKSDGEWDEFDGQATVWGFLNGIGSLEELRIPARQFAGMGLRLLDIEKGIWNDFWVNAKSPVLTTPGLEGQFINGVGTFSASEKEGDKEMIVRGVWDQITPDSCRWYQSISKDDGKTWEDNWTMQWHRVKT